MDKTKNGGSRPVPDPTELTTEQLDRATDSLRQYVDGQLMVRDERMSGIDKATELRLGGIEGIPGQIDEKVDHLQELFSEALDSVVKVSTERFGSIAQQFQERDIRAEQASAASAQALAAALQAAKELVGAQGEASAAAAVKSETSFTKQIDQIGTIIQTLEKALDARITELKERIDRGEGNNQGARETRIEAHEDHAETRAIAGESRLNISAVIAAVSLGLVFFFGAAGIIITLIFHK